MIEVSGLTKQFAQRTAVDAISFTVARGEIFAFLGPNGAGKSTTLQILTTLMPPTRGTVLIEGHDIVSDPAAVRRSLGVVFQDPSLDDRLTADENLALHAVMYRIPRRQRRARIEFLLRLVELWEQRACRVLELSGGMKRRLEIARAVMHQPPVLLLDEPTQGLDPQARRQIWTHLRDINSSDRTTIFFTTHYLDEAERAANHISIIDHGRIIADGTPARIKASAGVDSLEDAFLALTGEEMRSERTSNLDHLRNYQRAYLGSR